MRNRNNRIVFYLDDDELKELAINVKKSGHSREDYIRSVLLGYVVKEAPPVDYYTILARLSREGANLNQLIITARTLGFIDTPKLEKLMKEIRSTNQMLWDAFTEKKDGGH